MLSRFLYGGKTAILLAIAGNTLGSAIGIALGLTAAYRGGWTDELLGRAVDLALAFPGLVLALLLLAAFGTSQLLVMVAIAVTIAPGVARITRAAALGIVVLPYVEAAKARGESAIYIAVFEILPNIRSLAVRGLRHADDRRDPSWCRRSASWDSACSHRRPTGD